MAKCKWRTEDVVAKGAELQQLVTKHRTELETRVSAEVLDVVGSKLGELRELHRVQADSQVDKQASTASQRHLLKEAASYLGARRSAIRREFRDSPHVMKSFGVGHTLNPDSLSSVSAAIEMFVTAAKAAPEQARAAGVLPADVEELTNRLSTLVSREVSQESSKLDAKSSTAERNALQREIEAAMDKIVSAATLVFEARPDLVALFKSALPSRPRARKAAKKSSDAPEPTPSV